MKYILILIFGWYSCLCGQVSLFTEISDSIGLTYQYPGNDYQEVGAGVTIIDVNNDGWDDIFQSGGVFTSKLWLNVNGHFIDATSTFNLDVLNNHFILGVAAGDYNNDGWEDLFVYNFGEGVNSGDHLAPVLLKNIEGKRFEPVMTDFFSVPGFLSAAAWLDINGDGFPELYITQYLDRMSHGYDSILSSPKYIPICKANELLLNNEGKSFTPIGKKLGVNDKGCGLALNASDFDNDGDIDLILLNDFGFYNNIGNKIFRNEYPELAFTEVSQQYAFYEEMYGMGVGPTDFNNDGKLDYFLTNIHNNKFLIQEKKGFVNLAKELNLEIGQTNTGETSTSWSGLFFDYDNDADEDLVITKGYLNAIIKLAVKDQNQLFENHYGQTFENVSAKSGLNDSIANRGAALLDFDHDGDLDLVSGTIKMQQGGLGGLDQKIKFYRNNNANNNNWIGIRLCSNKANKWNPLGARVTVKTKSKKQFKEVDAASGHSSQSTRAVYFGLGKEAKIKAIEIRFISGDKLKFKNIDPNQCYQLTQTSELKISY